MTEHAHRQRHPHGPAPDVPAAEHDAPGAVELRLASPRSVIALQQTAGNKAVSGALGGARHRPGIAVQRWAWVAGTRVDGAAPTRDTARPPEHA